MHNSNEEILSKLRTLRSHIAAHNLLTQAKRLKFLVAKAGFRPNQARVPAGNPDGGQWADEGPPVDQTPRL